jgi:hypothetical protein
MKARVEDIYGRYRKQVSRHSQFLKHVFKGSKRLVKLLDSHVHTHPGMTSAMKLRKEYC